MIYDYLVTSEVKSWLERKNIGNDADEKLNNQMASKNRLNASVLMANLLVNKFNNHSALRYVWFQEIRQDVCLYILRRIYRHDEYEQRLNDATKQIWMRRHQLTPEEKEEVDARFSEHFKEDNKEPLPEEYRKYEETRAFDKYRDVIFYEMPLWHDGMKKVPKEYWSFIQTALAEDINKNYEQYDCFLYYTTNNYTLTYRYGDMNAIGKSDVYLLQIVKGNEPNYDELLSRKYDCEDVKYLQNISSKCYPDYYTYDYEAWKEVEEDDLANLALSEEEVKILQNIQFPFFVSGLAGSGKSTILYYLYANVYKYVALEDPEHKLLFLSYNDMLVDKARISVKSILSYHSTNEGFSAYFDDEKNLQHFNNSFVPFRDFLKNAFLDENSIIKFSEEKHITYEKFRELYQSEYRQAGRRLSASILWSVIRTFIKGRSLKYFTPEDYNSDEIARRDRTVDLQIYKEAYKIWDNWYRHYYEDEKGWDDLDLVRYALTHGDLQNVYRTYAVIFCDEAQDFTKLEIDLILSLSKHSKYKLSLHPDDKRIPIAFAGDPNQTINPTGFRWAGTKAIFTESFKDSLDNYPELDDPELSKNYRSQLGIVKFANTIQSIRYKYFDETSDRKLQSVREDPTGENQDALEYVGFYSYDKYKDIIIDNLSNANIITSGDGEEGDLALFPDITDKNVKLNTAIGTKGLEYNAVMLLNFSNDPAYKLFKKILNEEPFADESERFEIAHFFTKLYIAVSRARAQLFIVDTEESYEIFWKYFIEHNLWENLINRFIHDEEKRKLVGHVTMGDIETLPQRLSDSYDAEENGRQAFEKAKGEKSVSLMKRAQSYFLEASLTALADECDAYIFLFNMEYEKAGDKFVALHQKDKNSIANNAYWKGKCWQKLIIMLENHDDTSQYDSIRLLTSQFMADNITPGEFLQTLVDKIDYFQDALCSHLDDQYIWFDIFKKMEKDLQAMESVNISISITTNLDKLSRLVKWYDKGLSGLRADMYYKRAQFKNEGLNRNNAAFSPDLYEEAIRIWEEVGNTTDNKKYFTAKKLIAKNVSDEIVWMDKLQEQDAIYKQFGDKDTVRFLTDEAASIIFSILLSKDYGKAAKYPYPKDQQNKWSRLYDQDRTRFLTDIVLEDFTPEKFYFLADKTKLEESCVFDEKLPVSLFDLIFELKSTDSSDGKPYWTYFTCSLNGKNDIRTFKRSQNRERILESLSKHIVDENGYDKLLASCFLEFLFDSEYNTKRADKFCRTLIAIFSQDVFFKEDFRKSTERNKYFAYSKLEAEEHETIKNNIRKYIDHYLSSIKKIEPNTTEEVKSLLRAYEICVTYQGVNPNYLSLCNMYKTHLREEKYAEIKDWMMRRMLFNQFMDDNLLQKASFAKLAASFDEKGQKLDALIEDFSKEDASMFVSVVNTSEEESTYEKTLLSAKLIYKYRLRRDNLKPFCRVNDLITNLPDAIDIAIDEVLANKERVNEYAIKLLSYTWEALYEHTFVANHYDKLINKKRLERLRILTEYLKKRALLHYSYLKKDLFDAKQEEYGIEMTKDYLPAAYPRIEDKSVEKDSTEKSKIDTSDMLGEERQVTEEDVKRDTKRKKGKTVVPSPLDVAKMAQLEMARKLKMMGVPTDVIRKSAPQLTIEDIKTI